MLAQLVITMNVPATKIGEESTAATILVYVIPFVMDVQVLIWRIAYTVLTMLIVA